jgi:DNA primase
VAFDNDGAGTDATVRAWQLLRSHHHLRLRAATLPHDSDPADLITRPGNRDCLRAALTTTKPLGEAVIDIVLDVLVTRRPDLLQWPEGRLTAARTLAGLIIDQPAEQVVPLARHIAHCTNVELGAAADAVIRCLEQPPPVRPGDSATRTFSTTRVDPITTADNAQRSGAPAGPGSVDQPDPAGRMKPPANRRR